jgi:copper(I)-binding protein
MKRIALLFVAALAVAVPALAHDYAVGALRIGHPWSRPSPVGASAGAGYMSITNTGASDDRLTGGSTPVAARLEIHEMSMTGGVMKMRPVSGGLVIPAGETVTLAPGGYHIMFIGLKAPLKVGDHVSAALHFEKAGTITIDLPVQTPPGGGHGGGMTH